MKKLLITLSILLLTSCSTTAPVKRNFPDVPVELMETCPDLKKSEATEKLSEVLKVVVENYGQYYECGTKIDTWIEWYKSQKQIFESVK
jgi:hypothetical protein